MELLHQYRYSLVFSVILLEQLGLPIPAAPVLLLSGAFIAGGEMSLPLVLIAGVTASLIGDTTWYYIGRTKGRGVLKILCRLSLSPDSCVRKTESSFLKYGMNSLLFAKFLPGLNTIAPPMAGMVHAGLVSFLWRDMVGAVVYVLAATVPGILFERAVFDITTWIESVGRTFFWIAVGGFGLYLSYKIARLKILQKVLAQERITPQELHQRMQNGEDLIIVDLRSGIAEVDEPGPLPGAIRIPPGELDQHLHRLDKDRWIVMYCT